MKKISVILMCLCSLFLFTGCYTNEFGDGIEPNPNPTQNTEIEEISIKCKLDVAEDYNTDGLTALTMAEQKESIDADFEISAIKNGIPQLVFIEDDNENVFMISRGIYEKGQTVEINAETTTLALVTLHPLLGPITENYNELIQMIKASEYYQPLYDEVKTCIENKKNIFDARNDQLMVALSNLLNNLCEDPSEYIQTTRASIATRSRLAVNSYPIHISASGRTLTMKTIDLAPSYIGTVTTPSGSVSDLSVKSTAGYSVWKFLIKETPDLYGTPETFSFTTNGNYIFDLSRSNRDLVYNILKLSFEILGIRKHDLTQDLIDAMAAQVLAAMEENEDANWLAMSKSIIEMCGDVLYSEILKDPSANKFFAVVAGMAKGVTWAFKLYDGLTDSANVANAVGMLTWWYNSPKNINFCLCYNNGKIESCTEAELNKVSGDNQIGEANQRLLLPLKVKVVTKNDNGLILPNIYQNIKFKVDNNKGAVSAELVGTDDEASVYWTLGDGNPGDVQKVTAIVVDQTTGEDISDPVEFTASIKDEGKKEDDDIRKYLEKLYHDTDGDHWTRNYNWCCDDVPVEDWYGVSKFVDGTYKISLAHNNLKGSIDLSGCKKIKYLFFEAHSLTSINVSGCTALDFLDCYNNNLASLNASGCTALKTLYCDKNELESLDVSGCTALKYLHCQKNNLTSLNASECTMLKDLDCSENKLESLDVSGCTALKELDCSENKLESLDVSGCTALNHLHCQHNHITSEVPPYFKNLILYSFAHDRLYYYYSVSYTKNEYGWYYPGEPESMKHDWPSSDASRRQIKKK